MKIQEIVGLSVAVWCCACEASVGLFPPESEVTHTQIERVAPIAVYNVTSVPVDIAMTSASDTICMATQLVSPNSSGILPYWIDQEADGNWHLLGEVVGQQVSCWNNSSFSHQAGTRWYASFPDCGVNSACTSALNLPFQGTSGSYACAMMSMGGRLDTYPGSYAQVFANGVSPYQDWTVYYGGGNNGGMTTSVFCEKFTGRTSAPSIVYDVSNVTTSITLPDSNTAACGFSGQFWDWQNPMTATISQNSSGGTASISYPSGKANSQANITCIYF